MTYRDWHEMDTHFAANLKAARERAGVTQTDLAKNMAAMGFPFHQTTVYKIEQAERPVKLAEVVALAAALGVEWTSLAAPRRAAPDKAMTPQEMKAALDAAVKEWEEAEAQAREAEGRAALAAAAVAGYRAKASEVQQRIKTLETITASQ